MKQICSNLHDEKEKTKKKYCAAGGNLNGATGASRQIIQKVLERFS
jgi:hypothetical protein